MIGMRVRERGELHWGVDKGKYMILQSTSWKNTKTENRQIVNWKKGLSAIVFHWSLK